MDGKKLKINELDKKRRNKRFFLRDADDVAKKILGDYLVIRNNKRTFIGKIVETEGYLGINDDASHSFSGRITKRNKTLYCEGGVIYVYFIYGKYWCFNIVTSKENDPQAVLIRALEPLAGINSKSNKKLSDLKKLTAGPCRWTNSIGIGKNFLGKSITSRNAFVARNNNKRFNIACVKRVGIDYATKSKDLPLHFYIKDNPFVSKK